MASVELHIRQESQMENRCIEFGEPRIVAAVAISLCRSLVVVGSLLSSVVV